MPLSEHWESKNPLKRPKYDPQLFHQYNFELKRSIRDYDERMHIQQQHYPQCLLALEPYNIKPSRKWNRKGEQVCGVEGCKTKMKHLRSRLCEAHREANYKATKHETKREQDERVHGIRVPGLP